MYLDVLFYFFSFFAIVSALMVVASRNPVHAVFYLILVFSFSAGLILLLEAEFLGLIFVIVYVGAIAVLFLFVVMMLNVRVIELNETIVKYVPIGGMIGLGFFVELYYILKSDLVSGVVSGKSVLEDWGLKLDGVTNTEALGTVLYTYYVYYFMLAGVILLLAMVGTIVLTLHHNVEVKRQEVYKQVGRDFRTTVVPRDIVK